MRHLAIVFSLAFALTVPTCATGCPVTADLLAIAPGSPLAIETSVPRVVASPEPMVNGSQMKMVLIRASTAEIARLRKMHLEIVRVRPVVEAQTPTTKSE